MQYSNTMQLRNSLFALLMLLGTSISWAQTNNSSPYTRYAFGEINRGTAAAYFGMGSVVVPMADMNLVNVANPASYSYIRRYKPVFNVGVNGRFLNLSTGSATQKTSAFGLGEFIVGLPVGKNGGAAFGVLPYSTVGYQVIDTDIQPSIGKIDYIYEGEGGINRAFVGFSRKVVDVSEVFQTDSVAYRSGTSLSVGANVSYLFGRYSKIRTTDFQDFSFLDSRTKNSVQVSDFMFDAGIHFKKKFGANPDNGRNGIVLNAGATFTVGRDVNAKQSEFTYTYRSRTNSEIFEDTISYNDQVKGTLTLPVAVGLGASLTFKDKIKWGVEFRMQDWSQYKESFGGVIVQDQLSGAYGLSTGIEIQPSNDYKTLLEASAFKFAKYRLGFRYDRTALQLNGTNLDEIGMSFGISLPMIYSRTFSMLNVGVELGQKGTTANNLIQERFIGLKLGLTITPGRFDNWFYKRKYN